MDAKVEQQPRARSISLPDRGGVVAALEFGPPNRPIDVVFSHANGFNARVYRTILGPLGSRLRILAIDMRGHGASTLPAVIEEGLGWGGYADDLLAVLRETTDGPVVLAGHSMGATSSLLAAGKAPEVARALVLFEPVLIEAEGLGRTNYETPLAQGALRRRPTFASREAVVTAYRGRGAFKTWSESQLIDYVDGGFQDTAEGEVTLSCRPEWEAWNFANHVYDPWTAFERVRCPIRLFQAESESTARGDARLEAMAETGRIRLERIPGTTHFLPMERPELVRDALAEAAGGA